MGPHPLSKKTGSFTTSLCTLYGSADVRMVELFGSSPAVGGFMSVIKNNRGQGVLEMALIAVVMMMVATLVTTGLRNTLIVGKLIDGPWDIMRGMISDGVWGSPPKTKIYHPNYMRRHISLEAEKVR